MKFSKKMLSREDVLSQVKNIKNTPVDIEEWGGTVFVREMTAGDFCEWQGYLLNASSDKSQARAFLIYLTVVNDKNERLFTKDDIATLSNLSFLTTQLISDAIDKMNGFKEADEQEETSKN